MAKNLRTKDLKKTLFSPLKLGLSCGSAHSPYSSVLFKLY